MRHPTQYLFRVLGIGDQPRGIAVSGTFYRDRNGVARDLPGAFDHLQNGVTASCSQIQKFRSSALPEIVQRIRKEIRSSQLRDVVHFIGPRAEMTPYYDASDVFLLPSREDPFPLVMLEAASRDLPIVCFANSGGAPEFVAHDAGPIVPSGDTAKMAEEVMRLLSAPELSRRIGKAAWQKAMNRHTLSLGAPKIAGVIQEELCASEQRVSA